MSYGDEENVINPDDPYDANFLRAKQQVQDAKDSLDTLVNQFFTDKMDQVHEKEEMLAEHKYLNKLRQAQSELNTMQEKVTHQ